MEEACKMQGPSGCGNVPMYRCLRCLPNRSLCEGDMGVEPQVDIPRRSEWESATCIFSKSYMLQIFFKIKHFEKAQDCAFEKVSATVT